MSIYLKNIRNIFCFSAFFFLSIFSVGFLIAVPFYWGESGFFEKTLFFFFLLIWGIYISMKKITPPLTKASLRKEGGNKLSFIRIKRYKAFRFYHILTNFCDNTRVGGYYKFEDVDPIEVTLTPARLELYDESGEAIDWVDMKEIAGLDINKKKILLQDGSYWEFPLWMSLYHKREIGDALFHNLRMVEATKPAFERGVGDYDKVIGYKRKASS